MTDPTMENGDTKDLNTNVSFLGTFLVDILITG